MTAVAVAVANVVVVALPWRLATVVVAGLMVAEWPVAGRPMRPEAASWEAWAARSEGRGARRPMPLSVRRVPQPWQPLQALGRALRPKAVVVIVMVMVVAAAAAAAFVVTEVHPGSLEAEQTVVG